MTNKHDSVGRCHQDIVSRRSRNRCRKPRPKMKLIGSFCQTQRSQSSRCLPAGQPKSRSHLFEILRPSPWNTGIVDDPEFIKDKCKGWILAGLIMLYRGFSLHPASINKCNSYLYLYQHPHVAEISLLGSNPATFCQFCGSSKRYHDQYNEDV